MKTEKHQIYFDNTVFDLDTVIQTYSNYVYTVIYKVSANNLTSEDSEEIVSEVFFKLWLNKKKIKKFKTIKPYLGVITRHVTIDYLRKNKKVLLEYDDQLYSNIDNNTFETIELLDIFEKCTQHLSDMDKEIMMRSILKDENISDIADSTGIKKATIQVKIHRLKKKMAKSLAEMGYLNEF